MVKICILFVLLPHLFHTMVHSTTSCSEYLTYTIDPDTRKIFGRIEILPPKCPPENEEIYLKVALNATADSIKGTFRLELARSINESIQAVKQGRSLVYHVYFPSDDKFPTLSAIWINTQQYCLGPKLSGKNIKANIELGYIVYPPNKEPLLQFQPWHRNSSNYRINNPNYNSNDECGVTDYYTDSINRQIPNGANTLPGQWPWVVPVYYIRKKEKDFITTYEFQCGGSILTKKHIITVAYCVFSEIDIQNPKYIQADNLEVVFGQYNLFKLHGDGIVNIKVAFYILHPDFDYYLTSNLAILTLKKPVEYTPLTKPICLWSDYSSTTLEDVVGKTGYVVGWGQDPLGHRDFQEQRMIKVTIAGQETCLRSDNRYISYTSNRTFCANSLDEKNGLCDGDSGNALVLLNNHTGRYELRGLYSGGLSSGNTTLLCDPRLYDIYVDVVHFKSWIQRQILT